MSKSGKGCADTKEGCIRTVGGKTKIKNNKKGGWWTKKQGGGTFKNRAAALKKLSKIIPGGCKCDERKDWLNKNFPYKIKK